MAGRFEGFRAEALGFLVELALNNDRSWFQPHKADYERLLKEPLAGLCQALDGELRSRGIPLAADPVRSPFRIYRDVRFTRDKSPYKTNVGASFPWTGEGGGVGGYFHLDPGGSYIGGGMWHPSTPRLAAWRRRVVEDREGVRRALASPAFRATYGEVGGDRLTRAPRGFAPDDPDVELLKLKDVTFSRPLSEDELQAPDLPARLASALADAVPVLALLASLPDEAPSTRWLRD